MSEPEQEPMDIFTAMRKRKMIRDFLPEPVPPELMQRLLWAVGRAATARPGISQVLVVDDPGRIRTLRLACPGFVNNAPVAIAVCSDLEIASRSVGHTGAESVVRVDAGAVAAHLAVAAPALGLGVCYVMSFGHAAVRAVLDLPEHVRPEILVAVGFPDPGPSWTPKAAPRVVHHNTFGHAWKEPV